ncbi:UPF0481 protein At3g47200-like [Oryza brachyantha]|uniref:Uncharacterized protein n=1 Tax=Oryza brachyantha TaxID=4533 RepID=J3N8U8_ORYBR|nr:UPF0481 protein At3g47200-like [Oryza brachyantha]
MGEEAPNGGADNDHCRHDSSTSWVLEMEKLVGTGSEKAAVVDEEQWMEQSIYRVPEWIKSMHRTEAYEPRMVALGPLHHGEPRLLPMEEHKRRATLHLVRRSGRPLRRLVDAVEQVAEDLRAAYGRDLGEQWRGDEKNKARFVEVMLTDGCFLLELIQMCDGRFDYLSHDPVFGTHGRVYVWPVVQSDMLVLENQLPLLLLKRLLAVLLDIPPVVELDRVINHMVLQFLGRKLEEDLLQDVPLGLHPLDIFHTSLVYAKGAHEARKPLHDCYKYEIMPTAIKIHEAGIKIRSSKTDNLLDIHFEHGVLSMPSLVVDDDTERTFFNLMAFERLHVSSGNVLTNYVIFLDNIIESAMDVEMLSSKGVLRNMLGCDKETAKLFNGTLSKGAVLGSSRQLHTVQWKVYRHCRRPWNKWRASLIRTYFRNPWAFISLVAAAILLTATIFQTVYTIVPFYKSKP